MLLKHDDEAKDEMYWNLTSDGNFLAKSAYSLSLQNLDSNSQGSWKEIWKIHIPQRIEAFLWLSLHGKALANPERTCRGFIADPHCHLCTGTIENLDLILPTCDKAKTF